MTYYIDLINGTAAADGKSPENARKDYKDLDIKAGDKVLFKRGTFVREELIAVSGEEGNPVTYGAYGEGEKPVFCGSVNLGNAEYWVEIKENIWKCVADVPTEAGNFIFDEGKSYGTVRWSIEELCEQGDWYDSRMGIMCQSRTGEIFNYDCYSGEYDLIIYSEKNPGEYYSDIECAVFGSGAMAHCDHDTIFEDLSFCNLAVHGIRGSGTNITVRGCDFINLGGALILPDRKIRFGNAVEFWEICVGCVVENCYFYNIYDSGITHQGRLNEVVPSNNVFDNNFFVNCGMGAYECRDFLPANTSFNNNVCINAGEGFSKLGEVMPRNSEIWPLPMGHHIFIWRVTKPSEGGSLEIKGNKFYNAPYGAAIFAMASDDAIAQMSIDENEYFSENRELCNYFNGRFYKDFEAYQMDTGMDANGINRKVIPFCK